MNEKGFGKGVASLDSFGVSMESGLDLRRIQTQSVPRKRRDDQPNPKYNVVVNLGLNSPPRHESVRPNVCTHSAGSGTRPIAVPQRSHAFHRDAC